ncbi:1-acyl-sn-glycerol-3-phosphate acyltransferase [Arcanobacterium hippocoleae]|uniref:1-acyl-sn-glycerol-3-phosphate acyltransferase n=1 Tax=Arcanobacterium hippocoleae TaxID=149017 RepID=A0ABU1T2N5_9ACTO|nr:1-acyl-sn-glycerol-3-phosphate acyltransferase [Arcanobacterium hippocoleae]MDR6939603.1 1-acyl-sn-glycerol-3-phosphate acyltransferase [Arcanobacterium hippocoleae]
MGFLKLLSSIYLFFSPVKLIQGSPLPKKCIVIGAPHTSNWDGILMAIGLWQTKRKFRFFVKDSAVKSPFGPLIKAVGGMAIDRSAKHGVVGAAVEAAQAADDFLLVITPKGTRGKRDYWKSGFYHIAYQAKLPVVLGYLDKKGTKSFGWGKTIQLTGDMQADMDLIREFYADKSGWNPALKSEPRLRDEDNKMYLQ